MNRNGLALKFFLPVAASLAVLLGVAIWAATAYQTRNVEQAFEEHLTSLAVGSRSMVHSEAEDYCRSQGMAFHRVEEGRLSEDPAAAAFERVALQSFASDPSLAHRALHYRDAQGVPRVYVLSPGRLKESCAQCHDAFGVSIFKDRKIGDLVASFGVSMSTADLYRSQQTTRLLGAGAGLALLVLISAVTIRQVRVSILRPLRTVSEAIGQVAAGDMTARAAVGSEDEIGQLAGTFNGMVADLNQALRSMDQASERVASGSTELAASAEQMNVTVQETAQVGEDLRQAGQEVVEALRRLDANVETMADHTRRTGTQAEEAVQDTDRGAVTGRGTAEGMESIRQATARIVDAVQAIQGIARQTNLLSLNAAIEAAKAGTMGKGFAVVAEEIRILAERSGQSAKEIEDIVQAMQAAVSGGVDSVEVTLRHLEAIRDRISHVSGSIREIEGLSGGQARTGQDVGRMMNQTAVRLDQNAAATQELAATVRQVSDTADDLSRVAENLRGTVRRFKLG
ncbi:methyl-accepting chemotaxis protein [Geothrix sp. 21YS21S-4]|uniref:methyl-accepting chemotaxis protein n=1 Tax=Geothrix sp. 21YS21S-4 TaxID=3068889 RepID=UPI0027BAA698|nr:methyl-accepting chemotaxis protein [Geothrix sp. 21YS21S-4]